MLEEKARKRQKSLVILILKMRNTHDAGAMLLSWLVIRVCLFNKETGDEFVIVRYIKINIYIL